MNRRTILKSTGCDLKRLPLEAREAFFLSQVDGHVNLEEVAEVVGVDLDEALSLTKRLVELGAVSAIEASEASEASEATSRERRSKKGAVIERESRAPRFDPRAERDSSQSQPAAWKRSLQPGAGGEERSLHPGVGAGKRSLRPGRTQTPPPRHPTPRPERRRTRKSIHAQQAVKTAEDTTTDLDAATIAKIVALDAKVAKVDHYGLLEVDRDADRKTIKRAYFLLAATFHPDRFFGKKLGPDTRVARAHLPSTDGGTRHPDESEPSDGVRRDASEAGRALRAPPGGARRCCASSRR